MNVQAALFIVRCRRLKSTVNKVPSLRDKFHNPMQAEGAAWGSDTVNGERKTANGGVPEGRDMNNPMQAEGAAWGEPGRGVPPPSTPGLRPPPPAGESHHSNPHLNSNH
jgi:hypothetical protein